MSKIECDDPIYLHTLREAWLILVVWGLTFAWVVPYCWANGYNTADAGELEIVWGIPAWVVWGIAVPWLACAIVSIIIAIWVIHDDDLSEGMLAEQALPDSTSATEGQPA